MDEVKKLFAEKVKKTDLDPATELRTLGLDSLDLVEMMMDMEENFGIQFENDEMISFKTVQDVYDAIEKKLK